MYYRLGWETRNSCLWFHFYNSGWNQRNAVLTVGIERALNRRGLLDSEANANFASISGCCDCGADPLQCIFCCCGVCHGFSAANTSAAID